MNHDGHRSERREVLIPRRTSGRGGGRLVILAWLAAMALPGFGGPILFQDDFRRPSSEQVGGGWREFLLRGGEAREGDSPWRIAEDCLRFQATGEDAYIEDFVETTEAFPVDGGLRIEFECRGQVGTSKGYVGPAVLLVPEGAVHGPGYAFSPVNTPIGVAAWYQWEMQGRSGLLVMANGRNLLKQGPQGAGEPGLDTARFAGLNEGGFARHVLTIADGRLTYSSPVFPERSWPLAKPLAPGERRRLAFAARLYDRGVPQTIVIRKVRVSGLSDTTPSGTDLSGTTTTGPALPPTTTTSGGQDRPGTPPPAAGDTFTQLIQPSSNDQVVTTPLGQVTIPGGVLAAPQVLRIAPGRLPPEQNPLPPKAPFGRLIDLSLGDQHAFTRPLTLEGSFDPATLVPQTFAKVPLAALHWEADIGRWKRLPLEIDAAAKTFRVKTDRLSLLAVVDVGALIQPAWAYTKDNLLPENVLGEFLNDWDAIQCTAHFNVCYNEAKLMTMYKEGADRLSGIHYTGSSSCGSKFIPDIVEDTVRLCEAAYDGFQRAGFDMGKVTMLNGGRRNIMFYPGSSSFRSLTSGVILLSTVLCSEETSLKRNLAHEMFHGVQNAYYNSLLEMNRGVGSVWHPLDWWLEATAVFASSKVPWDLGDYDRTMEADYFRLPVTSSEGEHAYQTVWLFDALARKGVSFRDLFVSVAAAHGSWGFAGFTNTLKAMADFLGPLGIQLPAVYDEWLRDTVFSRMDISKAARIAEFADQQDLLKSTDPGLARTFTVKGGYAAVVWTIMAGENPPGTDPASPRVLTLQGNIPAGVIVSAFAVPDLKRPQRFDFRGQLTGTGGEASLALGAIPPRNYLVILAANTGTGDQTIALAIAGGGLTLAYNGSELVVTGAFPTRARFEWEFGDGSPNAVTTEPRIAHPYAGPATGPGQSVTSIRALNGVPYTAKVRVFDAATNQPVGEAVTTFHVGGALRQHTISDR